MKETLREDIFFDHMEHVSLTVWGDLIHTIDGGKRDELYELQLGPQIFGGCEINYNNFSKCIVFGSKQELPILSDDNFKKYIDHENGVNAKLNSKSCCLELSGTNVTVGAACTNENCGKPIPTVPGQRVVICINCNTTMSVDKCPCIFNCVLTLNNISLSLPTEVASYHLQEDVMKLYQRDDNFFKGMLCFQENIDCTYNSKNVITKKSNHIENQFP